MNINDLVVRPFEAVDLSALLVLEQNSVAPAEQRSPKSFDSILSSLHEQILVAVLDRQIVGYVGYTMPSPPFQLMVILHRIVVNKDLRRRGIGQSLLNEVLAISARQYDCIGTNRVPVEDKVSQQFLSKNEFEDAGAQAYQCTHCNMALRKRRWKLIPDGKGSYKPVPE